MDHGDLFHVSVTTDPSDAWGWGDRTDGDINLATQFTLHGVKALLTHLWSFTSGSTYVAQVPSSSSGGFRWRHTFADSGRKTRREPVCRLSDGL